MTLAASIATLALAAAADLEVPKPEDALPGWRLWSMRYTVDAKLLGSGLSAWTPTTDGLGAAFRCDRGILYAFVAMEEVDMAASLMRLGGTSKNWNVTVTIDGYEPREEKWITVHGGKFLMARRISTTKRLFRAARAGVSVTIEDKRGKPVTVSLPADDTGVLDAFEARCDLHDAFDGPAD